uniref:Uncharacterized protein n=1 Tax=Rhizophora mucronata TaxID=61149 RepID=A0A2P2N5T0_RHIMU
MLNFIHIRYPGICLLNCFCFLVCYKCFLILLHSPGHMDYDTLIQRNKLICTDFSRN